MSSLIDDFFLFFAPLVYKNLLGSKKYAGSVFTLEETTHRCFDNTSIDNIIYIKGVMAMLYLSVFLFLCAALTGATMLTCDLRGKYFSNSLVVLHGVFAASALVLLILSVLSIGASGMISVSLLIFLAAALGGVWLFVVGKKKKAIPTLLILGHGLVAVIAFSVLIIYMVGSR